MLNHELLGSLKKVKTAAGFVEEYNRIVQYKPNRKNIDSKVLALLDFIIRDTDPSVFCRHKCIENLKDANDLFSMKIKTDCNIRILFSLEKDGTILLHSFEEKAGKKVTEYSSAIETAKGRLQKMKGRKK